jgi:tRNA (cmo5U34)-methyltransferase
MVKKKLDHKIFDGENYDHLIGNIIPYYPILLRTAVQYLPAGAKNILELGCGTGILTEKILDACPHAEVTGVDIAADMLDKARAKPSLKKARFVRGDIRDAWPEEHYDAIITTLCLHHLSKNEWLHIGQRASRVLAPEGRFICGDIFRTDHEWENRLLVESWQRSMLEGNVSEDIIAEMTAQYIRNAPKISTIPEFRNQLTKAGFSCTFAPLSMSIVGLIIGFISEKDGMPGIRSPLHAAKEHQDVRQHDTLSEIPPWISAQARAFAQ